jgi:hypothetical protein
MTTRTTQTDAEFWAGIDDEQLASQEFGRDFARERREADEFNQWADEYEPGGGAVARPAAHARPGA